MDKRLYILLKQIYDGKQCFSCKESENFNSVVNQLKELRRCNFIDFPDTATIKDGGGMYGDICYSVGKVQITYKGERIIEANLLTPAAKEVGDILTDEGLIKCREDFERALTNLAHDPEQSIASACSTLESILKAILDKKSATYKGTEDIQELCKLVYAALKIAPDTASISEIKRIENGLLNAALGVGVIRSKFSTAHGRSDKQQRLDRSHARLAVNAVSVIGLFLLECYLESEIII